MFAVIESLGHQYKVAVGDVIHVDRISDDENAEVPAGSSIVFNQVLMLSQPDGSDAKIGQPYLEGAQVLGELVENGKDKKVIAFKKKRRKGYHKKKGHRRQFAAVVIKEIKAA